MLNKFNHEEYVDVLVNNIFKNKYKKFLSLLNNNKNNKKISWNDNIKYYYY